MPERPGDATQLAKLVVEIATRDAEDGPDSAGKNPPAVAPGRRGGSRGGKTRAAKMSGEERKVAAKTASETR